MSQVKPTTFSLMCNITTQIPDEHVSAILNHMMLNILSALTAIRSIANKSILDAHYLKELGEHKALEKPLPAIKTIRSMAIKSLREQRKQWEEDEKKKKGKVVLDQYWDIPDETLEKLVDWLLVDLIKQ